MKILCFPYAGASSTVYTKFKSLLKRNIHIVPIEIPGRGLRNNEKLENTISSIVDKIYVDVLDEINDGELYVVFGHSMGGLIAYELVYRILQDSEICNKPQKLLVSGCGAPQFKENSGIYKLPVDKLKAVIMSYGLTTSEVFENNYIMEYFLPIFRADFEAVEKYHFYPRKKIDIDVTCFYGSLDKSLRYRHVLGWKEITTQKFNIHTFSGSHFFIFEKNDEFIEKMIDEVLNIFS